MRLIIIYGPPGVGKYTTAKELSSLTGFKLFHNHLTVDLAKSLFEFGTEPFFRFCDKLRNDVFEIAAKEDINGLIFTFCYSDPEDNEFIKRTTEIVENNNGKVNFVKLSCNKEELEKRIVDESRKAYQKIVKVEELYEALNKWNLTASIPFVESLEIDNTKLSYVESAQMIKTLFQL
jgi:deoxyadenosine/deoxycytidine kinase